MNERRKLIIAGVGLALAVLITSLVVFSPPAERATAPFEVTHSGNASSTAELRVDGTVFISRTVYVEPDAGEYRSQLILGNQTVTKYQTDGRTFTRLESQNESRVDRYVDQIDDGEIIQRTNDTVVVLERDAENESFEKAWNNSLVLDQIRLVSFKQVNTTMYEDEQAVVYEPQSQFVSGPVSGIVRVEDTSGQIIVDEETGRLYEANVTYRFVRADSWGEYLYHKARGGGTQVQVTYQYSNQTVVQPLRLRGNATG